MKFSQLVKLLQAAQPEKKLHSDHRVINRRDLLVQGLLGFSGAMLLPAFGGFRSSRLRADGTRAGVICIDLAGGGTLPFNFPPIQASGEPLSFGGLHTVGIPRESLGDPANGALDYSLGVGMNPASHMLAGIKQFASAEALSKVNGYLSCLANRDDSRENEHNPLHTLAHAGYAGSVVPGVGSNESASGGNSAPATEFFNPTSSPVVIRNVNDAIGTVLPRTLSKYFDRETFQEIFRATQRWSVQDQAALHLASADEQLAKVSKILDKKPYEQALAQVSKFKADDVDLTKVPDLSSLWMGDEGAGSLVKMVSDGMAACGTLSLGGFDYHNNGSVNCNDADFRAGSMIGKVIEHFHRTGRNLMLCIFTDGGTAGPAEGGDLIDDPVTLVDTAGNPLLGTNGAPITMGGPRIGPTGDSGARGLRVTLFANNSGAGRLQSVKKMPASGSLQVGGYKDGGNADKDAVITGENPALSALVDVYNLMILDGLESQFHEKFPKSPIGTDEFQFFEKWG